MKRANLVDFKAPYDFNQYGLKRVTLKLIRDVTVKINEP
jgi:hypothetical protein